MNALLLRVKNILIRPRHEWQAIKDEPATYAGIIFRYVGFLAAVPPAAAVVGKVVFDRGIVGNAVHNPLSYVIAANILWYIMIIVNVLITGAVITAVAAAFGSAWSGLRGLKIAAYSFTPLFIVGVPIVIPRLGWLAYVAIAYSVYLVYLGINSLLEIKQGKAAWHAIASFLTAGAIVGTLNMFEYMLESYLIFPG
ncbi:MAG: Yip1 family protein [Betaproteobacteria bacterium]